MYKEFIKKIVKNIEGAELGKDIEVSNWVSTGNFALNKCISNDYLKGLPFGRVVDVFGDPSTGKSLLIYHIIANVQKMGGVAILDDTEDAYIKEFGEKIGINNNELIRLNSLTVEEHFEKVFLGGKDSKGKEKASLVSLILEEEPNCKILVALDSLALLSTRHELEVLFEKPDMIKAKQIRAGLRMASNIMKKANILHLISNHVTSKIGVLYGKKTTTPGGTGVPFSAAVRLELSGGSKIKNENDIINGIQTSVYIAKNKVNSPFKKCIIDIYFDRGVKKCSGLLQSFVDEGIVTLTDNSRIFSYKNESFEKKGFLEFLKFHKEMLDIPK